MRRVLMAGMVALALAACRADAPPADPALTAAAPKVEQIEAVMADSAEGWNAGDMDRFLAIYSAAPETSFVSADGLLRGRAAMEKRYRAAYDWSKPDPAGRGVLSFATEDFRPIGSDHALYIGRYTLTYPDPARAPASGLTSLLFAREGTSWRIIADHSS